MASARQMHMNLLDEPVLIGTMQEAFLSMATNSLQSFDFDDGSQPHAQLQMILDLSFLAWLAGSCTKAAIPIRERALDILKERLDELSTRVRSIIIMVLPLFS